jgi:palmitoyl transferase
MQVGISCLLVIAVAGALARDVQAEESPGLWDRSTARISNIAAQGDWDLYLSGYAYHSRSTYTRKRIDRLNEKAWGGGFGKSMRNDSGNDESLYVLVIRDSLYKPQWAVGYTHEWMFPLGGSGLEAGVGVTALIMRRSDWADGYPVPAVLPVASFGTRKARLEATYVPRLSTGKGKGNIILVVGRFTFG